MHAWWPCSLHPGKGVLTHERKAIYDAAVEMLVEPDKLRQLADLFEKEELPDQAKGLRERASALEPKGECKCGRAKAGCEYHDPNLQGKQ